MQNCKIVCESLIWFLPFPTSYILRQYFTAAAENHCRGACVKHLVTWAFAAANAPTIISRLVFFANRPGAADVFLNGPRVAGVLHLTGASDDHFQRLCDSDLRVACAGSREFSSFGLQ